VDGYNDLAFWQQFGSKLPYIWQLSSKISYWLLEVLCCDDVMPGADDCFNQLLLVARVFGQKLGASTWTTNFQWDWGLGCFQAMAAPKYLCLTATSYKYVQCDMGYHLVGTRMAPLHRTGSELKAVVSVAAHPWRILWSSWCSWPTPLQAMHPYTITPRGCFIVGVREAGRHSSPGRRLM